MNVTRLFLGESSGATLTHVLSTSCELTRTWQELRERVASLGRGFLALGVRRGDRILIVCTSRVEVIECVLSAFSIGAVAMPVSPLMGGAGIASIVGRMRPSCCVFEGHLEQEIEQALHEHSAAMVALEAGPNAERSGYRDFEQLATGHRGPLELASLEDAHPALAIHSSGSSGVPKVVVLSHGALLRFYEYHDLVWRQYADAPDSLIATTPMVNALPFNHLAGISICLQCLMTGRSSYFTNFFLPDAYLKLLERTRCPFVLLVPSMYRSVLDEPLLRSVDLSSVRCCIIGGEPCSADLLDRIGKAFGAPVATAYSMTECLSGIGHSRKDIFERRIKPGSCGRQLFGEVTLRDENGAIQQHFGELWVRNATVHRCYLDPAMNDERLQAGWYRTGDLFERDEDGDFFHRGRVDDMFICNGKNIYPLEMELLILKQPGVEAVCAAPVHCVRRGTIPAALVVTKEPMSEEAIQDFCILHGPTHAVPQFIRFVDAIPLLGPGKTDRRTAAALLQAGYDAVLREPRSS